MAKKGNRQLIGMNCSECKRVNYATEKNVINTKDKTSLSKFCRFCRKHTTHNESKLK